MKVIVFGKYNRPRGPRPVELVNFDKIHFQQVDWPLVSKFFKYTLK